LRLTTAMTGIGLSPRAERAVCANVQLKSSD
jgi:hypothetical protein